MSDRPSDPAVLARVAALNRLQHSGTVHPFTCGSGRRTDALHLDGEGVLVATPEGWVCPFCDYQQAFTNELTMPLPPSLTQQDGPGGRHGAVPERWPDDELEQMMRADAAAVFKYAIAGSETADTAKRIPGLLNRVRTLEAERDRLAQSLDRLAAAVLGTLAAAGIPTPERGYLGAERAGEGDAAGLVTADIQQLARERDALRAEVARLQAQIEGHAERIVGQSELLTRRAEGAVTPEAPIDAGLSCTVVVILYRNWKGVTAQRHIIPRRLSHAATEWHKERQWLLEAYDLDKQAVRSFALKDVLAWGGREGAVTPDVVRDAEVRGVRAGLLAAADAILPGRLMICPAQGSEVWYRDKHATTIRGIDPASVAVGGPGEE